MYVMVEAPAKSQGLVNSVSFLIYNEGIGLLKLANIVLSLINPSPCQNYNKSDN